MSGRRAEGRLPIEKWKAQRTRPLNYASKAVWRANWVKKWQAENSAKHEVDGTIGTSTQVMHMDGQPQYLANTGY